MKQIAVEPLKTCCHLYRITNNNNFNKPSNTKLPTSQQRLTGRLLQWCSCLRKTRNNSLGVFCFKKKKTKETLVCLVHKCLYWVGKVSKLSACTPVNLVQTKQDSSKVQTTKPSCESPEVQLSQSMFGT